MIHEIDAMMAAGHLYFEESALQSALTPDR
jgi:hypothetical protein